MRWRAPGRVNLIGEHTDYNDGWVLPFALPLGITASVTKRADDVVTIRSADWPGESVEFSNPRPGDVTGWAAYAAGAVWACGVTGADVRIESDLPVGAGLSSSAAVECAVVGAVGDEFGLGLSAADVVRLAHRAEVEFAGVPVGVLDQSAVVHCTAGHALFLDTRTGDSRQVRLRTDGYALLVIDTRAPHRLVDGEYARRRAECARAAAALGVLALRDADLADVDRLADDVLRRRARHVVSENARVHAAVAALDADDLPAVGPLLTASHVSLRDDYEVSCRELDLAVDTALAAGAVGARMTGGGFGGSAIALVPESTVGQVSGAVSAAFAAERLIDPVVHPVVPSAGAHRLA